MMVLQATDRTAELPRNLRERYDRECRITGFDLPRLGASKVLVVGAGAGGSCVIAGLALSGAGSRTYGGEIAIVDFDRLEPVNVSRWLLGVRPGDLGRPKAVVAAERAHELNPDVNAVAMPIDAVYGLGSAHFARYDVILLCVDNVWARVQLGRRAELWPGRIKAVIEGGLNGLQWAVHAYIPGVTACHECTMSEAEYAELRRRYSCQGQAQATHEPPAPMSIASTLPAAGIMVQEAIHALLGLPLAYAGRELRFDANGHPARVIKLGRRAECPGHASLPAGRTLVLPFGSDMRVAELRRMAAERIGCAPESLSLAHDQLILHGVRCQACGFVTPTGAPPTLFDLTPSAPCPNCGSEALSADADQLLRPHLTLAAHGVPPEHIIRAYTPEHAEYWLVPETPYTIHLAGGCHG